MGRCALLNYTEGNMYRLQGEPARVDVELIKISNVTAPSLPTNSSRSNRRRISTQKLWRKRKIASRVERIIQSISVTIKTQDGRIHRERNMLIIFRSNLHRSYLPMNVIRRLIIIVYPSTRSRKKYHLISLFASNTLKIFRCEAK